MRAPTIVIAPDSFKGSVTAIEAAAAIAEGLRRVWRDADLRECALADGGEGTLAAILSAGGTEHRLAVEGASGERVDAAYGLIPGVPDGLTGVIEIAEVVGITDKVAMGVDVARRSTRGIGSLLAALLDRGVRHFLIGLGGSSTNDGGAGLLAGLGMRLLDAGGAELPPTPEGLSDLAAVDVGAMNPYLAYARMTLMSDVNNPLCGERGATAIFGPQKGVKPEDVARIDASLARFARLTEEAFGRSAHQRPGAGAAGGLGFALQLLGATFRSGAEVIADVVKLDQLLDGCDWLITGEGRSDEQTLLGKTPFVAAARARARGVPATLLSGSIDPKALPQLKRQFSGCFSITYGPMSLEAAVEAARELLADRAEQLAQLWEAARRRPANDGPPTVRLS